MKLKLPFTLLILLTFLTSCAPGTTSAPTNIPTATLAPTITPINAPVTLADLPELSTWVEEYVHAYGGKVTVNGVEMDAQELTAAIRQNPEAFTQTKQVNGVQYAFVLVNEIPLVYQDENGSWQEATMSKLGEWNGVVFGCGLRLDARKYQEFLGISKKIFGNKSEVDYGTNLDETRVFGDFLETDWQSVLNNWDKIEQEFSSGSVPTGYPYCWQWGIDGMDADVVRAFGENLQIRSSLYEQGIRPDGNRNEALRLFQARSSQADMLKIFEYVVRTRVLQFPQIKKWNVSSEVSGGFLMFRDNGVPFGDVNFWGVATGLSPSELTLKVAEWVKKDNPNSKTYVVEDNIFDTGNPIANDLRDYFFNTYIPELIKGNEDHIIDGVIGENNWWIGEPQDWSVIADRIDFLISNGFEIGGSETMIVSGDIPINDCCGRHPLVEIQDPRLAQAEMYAQWVNLYLDKGIKTIGFGEIDDFYAWMQDVGLPDANPTLFDIDFRAKPAYYAILKVLYEHLR